MSAFAGHLLHGWSRGWARGACALWALLAALALAAPPSWAAPAVAEIRIGVHPDNRLRVVIEADEQLQVTAFELPDPYRIVLDLPEVDWRVDPAEGEKGTGYISGYRFGQFAPGRSRVVFDLRRPALVDKVFHLPPAAGQTPRWRLVVDLAAVPEDTFRARMTRPAGPQAGTPPSQAAVFVPPPSVRPPGDARKRVVVIDPGHGGVDPGAIGRKGVHEKQVTLAVGLALRTALQKRGRYEVVMTRDRDVFVRLRQRVAMARAAGADLFISLHADSNPVRSVRGASVYTLSERASDAEAAALAAQENKADLIAGVDLSAESNEVTNILIDLAQRETMNHSARFASLLVGELDKSTRVLSRSHRFAGFAVLRAPDVPSVLVELGYLSNAADEELLMQPRHRARLAETIANAVDAYFDRLTANGR